MSSATLQCGPWSGLAFLSTCLSCRLQGTDGTAVLMKGRGYRCQLSGGCIRLFGDGADGLVLTVESCQGKMTVISIFDGIPKATTAWLCIAFS